MWFCPMHSITRGFKVPAYGKIKCFAATLSLCSFYCFLDRPSCISFPAQLSQEMVKFYSDLMKGAGQRSASSPRCLEKNRGESQWLFSTVCLWPLLSQSTEPECGRLTQLSPEPVDGGGPHACGGLPPSGTHCHCAGSLSWETQGNVLPCSEP